MIPSIKLSCSATVEVELVPRPDKKLLNAKDVFGDLAPSLIPGEWLLCLLFSTWICIIHCKVLASAAKWKKTAGVFAGKQNYLRLAVKTKFPSKKNILFSFKVYKRFFLSWPIFCSLIYLVRTSETGESWLKKVCVIWKNCLLCFAKELSWIMTSMCWVFAHVCRSAHVCMPRASSWGESSPYVSDRNLVISWHKEESGGRSCLCICQHMRQGGLKAVLCKSCEKTACGCSLQWLCHSFSSC